MFGNTYSRCSTVDKRDELTSANERTVLFLLMKLSLQWSKWTLGIRRLHHKEDQSRIFCSWVILSSSTK